MKEDEYYKKIIEEEAVYRVEQRRKIWLSLFYIGMIIMLIWCMVWTHEFTHAEIMRLFGCEEIVFKSYVVFGYTQCLDENRMMSEAEALAHSINEIVTYNIGILLMGVLALFYTKKLKEM